MECPLSVWRLREKKIAKRNCLVRCTWANLCYCNTIYSQGICAYESSLSYSRYSALLRDCSVFGEVESVSGLVRDVEEAVTKGYPKSGGSTSSIQDASMKPSFLTQRPSLEAEYSDESRC